MTTRSEDPTNIFISHSFDHPDKYLRLHDFLGDRRVSWQDRSVPEWDKVPGHTFAVQREIRRRIAACERFIVVITDTIHRSPWITQEILWARQLGKPIIGIYEHGSAGGPIPQVLADSPHTLIGWNSNSLKKAVLSQDVHEYRVLDLAEDADRLQAAARLGIVAGAASVLVAGASVARLRQLGDMLHAGGFATDLIEPPDFWTWVRGGLLGALGGAFVAQLVGRTPEAWKHGLLPGALVGAGVAVTHACTMQQRRFGPLLELSRAALPESPASLQAVPGPWTESSGPWTTVT